MKVVVLGSGVIGVTSAWYLARAGHEVTVVDRQPAPALETSFANAGEVSPGYSAPWAAPGVPGKALKWLFMTYAPLVLRPKADPAQWRFLTGILANCTSARYKVNKGRMVRLAEYARDKLQALRAETGITYDERTLGTLQVFRTQAQMDGIGKDTAILDAYGVPYQVLDRAGCLAAEPGLAPVADKIVGGLRLPGDETGDCFKFTQRLAEMAAGAGVEFLMGVTINRIEAEGGRVRSVDTNLGTLAADAVVVALGSYSPFLVKSLGLKLPVYPVKGYSLTAPITNPDLAPVSTVMDETFKVAATRLGDRIRVAGIAEVGGFDTTFDEHRARTVVHSAKDLWSAGSDLSKREIWAGLRPMTPDGTPVVGPTSVKGLYLNTGHGTLGWTMACGSGALLADLVSGKVPEIDTEGLFLSRYQRGGQGMAVAVGKPALAGH